MNATQVKYNETRVAREFENKLTSEGAQLVYFYSKTHTVVLRRGADEQVVARLQSIEDARKTWKQWQTQLEKEGFAKIN